MKIQRVNYLNNKLFKNKFKLQVFLINKIFKKCMKKICCSIKKTLKNYKIYMINNKKIINY